ncbi:phytanoyl-CoA hydroxylase [Nannocystis exedens]|uniref:Phytanoyl-CoA hydroxylase n=1 Tax=Nannocystis exedens TaxID=54 RepID=A0A1I2A9A2_9BACT|nr:phytanoyl-CoA dioxygenase family protein [Nannocystis exedens]PCC69663.1 Phytanoyl-CoA dioxygenase (PhyH) [Nannocystis exedens]SFE39380.1 phytanoyl-CoA hydroxylase [Nannocystis exedens]
MLSREQVDEFREQGYVVLPSLVGADALASIRAAALAIVDRFDPEAERTVFTTKDRDAGRDDVFFASAEGVRCFLEEGALDPEGRLRCPPRLAINKIGHALHDLVPEFRAFCRQPRFGALLRDLGYAAPVLWQTMFIFKQPRIGGEVRWHQDATYLICEPACVTGLWVALEDAHRDNGCLWVQPGGHRTPLRERYEVDWRTRTGTLRTLDATPWPGPDEAVALEVPAGTVVVFHDHLPHRSSHNHSAASRHAFTMHVAEKGAAWAERNWLQRPRLGDFAL